MRTRTSPSLPAGNGLHPGLRENLPQFALLVVGNAFVGAMVGLERSILPAIAEQEFQLAARTALPSFIVALASRSQRALLRAHGRHHARPCSGS